MLKENVKTAHIAGTLNDAVNKQMEELLSCATASDYQKALTELWEAWITHENTNGVNHLKRSEMLFLYKKLMDFF